MIDTIVQNLNHAFTRSNHSQEEWEYGRQQSISLRTTPRLFSLTGNKLVSLLTSALFQRGFSDFPLIKRFIADRIRNNEHFNSSGNKGIASP